MLIKSSWLNSGLELALLTVWFLHSSVFFRGMLACLACYGEEGILEVKIRQFRGRGWLRWSFWL